MQSKTPSVTAELTKKVAHLARLKLSSREWTLFTDQLGQVLKYVDHISKVNTKDVLPMTHPLDLETPFREDEIVPSLQSENGEPKMLDAAPEVAQQGFKVPRIL